MAGISSRHGGHHVAQKLIMTTLPRCSARWKFAPPGVGTVKASASFGRAGLMRSSSLIASATGRTRTRRGRAAAVAATSGAAGAGGTAARSDVAGVGTRTARSSASRDSTVKKPTAAAADTATTAITTAGSGRIESRAVYLYIEPPPMKPTRARPLTIVADDLTGACDTGALFAARAPVPVSVWPWRAAADAVVRVVDTESRALSGPDAAERMATVAAGGRARHWFKKIDSTLRGPVGAEVDALMRATGVTTAIVCPAFPAQRRVVLDRVLLVGGAPVAETPIARDPHFPAGGSSVVELLRPQLDRALAWIPIDQLRTGAEALTARVRRLAGTAIVADAE